MTRPRLLDLFCGGGGATRGYQLAGFHVTGVDLAASPNYCGDEFHQADALDFPLDGYDAIHASPVCYAWSKMRDCRPGSKVDQPDLITPLRPRLEASSVPYVIENVPGAPLINPVQLCGSGLGMALQRHRWFESNIPLWGVPCAHGQNPWNPDYGHSTGRRRRRVPVIGEWRIRPELQHEAMGIDWMTLAELTEAIPPAFTQHIGIQILDHLRAAA
jgi:DNA (cytosine-5)-methyltransferase 1